MHSNKIYSILTHYSTQLDSFLFKEKNNSGLILFRIIFGFLMSWHCFDCIYSGWVKHNFIIPKFTFTHIGFEWLQPLPGQGMYYYFAVMGILGICISLGFLYRWSIIFFTLLWTGVFLMQKTSYNNHYYLMVLISFIMCFQPAEKNFSLDAVINPKIKTLKIPAWCIYIMIFQIAIVYFYATVAKFYPDWLNGTFTKNMLAKRAPEILKNVYAEKWFYLSIAYLGIIYDLLIVVLLLYKRTRNYAFAASLFFHLFNKLHLGIGIFPFLALSFTVFFYPPETFNKLFNRKTSVSSTEEHMTTGLTYGRKFFYWVFIPYFILQIVLPIRHWFIKDDVLWTEEGHRLSWRMMLRQKSGNTKFYVVDNTTQKKHQFKLKKILTRKQIRGMKAKPDMIWQTAQKIKEYYHKKGKDISIYIDCKVSINKQGYKVLIDPKTDFAKVEWNYFQHNEWLLPSKQTP